MKIEKLVKTIKCDQCPKEVSDNGDKYFGCSPFHDWMHLSITNGSSYVGEMNKQREFDFCSMKCLYEFSNSRIVKDGYPIKGDTGGKFINSEISINIASAWKTEQMMKFWELLKRK